jgi:hypothetical protein
MYNATSCSTEKVQESHWYSIQQEPRGSRLTEQSSQERQMERESLQSLWQRQGDTPNDSVLGSKARHILLNMTRDGVKSSSNPMKKQHWKVSARPSKVTLGPRRMTM